MKRIVISLFLLLSFEASASPIGRGSLCQDQVCWNMQQSAWQVAVTKAQGHYSKGISKMLVEYVRLGHPQDDFISKRYLKLHNQFVKEMRAAGRIWLYETQGYDMEHAVAIEDSIVEFSEISIDEGLLNAWFFGVYQ